MEIRLLTEETISRISAGEVIERPLNVVKELVENSIDAGSTAITVEIRDGGISMIRVTDNGCGIERDQIARAFIRHATSKITDADDLSHLSSLGFRGEALASIAAVAQVEMITKVRGALSGTRAVNDHLAAYSPDAPVQIDLEEIGAPDGTTVIVRNLFGKIPVRRRFLRQPQTEAGYITDLIEKQALSHPLVSFHYRVNGQDKLHTTGNGNLRELIYRIYGRETAGAIIPVHAEDRETGMVLDGFLGRPEVSRSSRAFETFFINGRMLRSKELSAGLEEGYRTDLMQHRFPFAVLHLTMPPEQVDVNVHPSKMEVRFTDRRAVFHFLDESVHNALRPVELIPKATLSTAKEERTQSRKEAALKQQHLQAAPHYEAFEKGRTDRLPSAPAVSYGSAASAPGQAQTLPLSAPGQAQTLPLSAPGQAQTLPSSAPGQAQMLPSSASGQAQMLPLSASGQAQEAAASLPGQMQKAAASTPDQSPDTTAERMPASPVQALSTVAEHLPASSEGPQSTAAEHMTHMPAARESSQSTVAGPASKTASKTVPAALSDSTGDADGFVFDDRRSDGKLISSSAQGTSSDFSDARVHDLTKDPASVHGNSSGPETDLPEGQLTLENLFAVSAGNLSAKETEEEHILTPQKAERFKYIGQVFGTYWIIEYEKRLLIIDQHAAHEKVNYERMMRRIEREHPSLSDEGAPKEKAPEEYLALDRLLARDRSARKDLSGKKDSAAGNAPDSGTGEADKEEIFVASQQLMPPIVLRLSGREESAYQQFQNVFAAMGYEIEDFGGGTYAIRAVPTELFGQTADSLLRETLEEIMNERVSGTPRVIISKVASMSCKAAVKGNNRLSETEARALIDELLSLENPYHCPHGRPTMIVMTQHEMDRKFKRIV